MSEFALPVSTPLGLLARILSLAANLEALSPRPKIPFLADKAWRRHEAFAAQALNAGGVRNGPVFGAYAAPGWAYSPGHSLSCWSSAFAFLRSGVPKPSVNQP